MATSLLIVPGIEIEAGRIASWKDCKGPYCPIISRVLDSSHMTVSCHDPLIAVDSVRLQILSVYLPVSSIWGVGGTFLALFTIFNKILQLVVKINIFQINQ